MRRTYPIYTHPIQISNRKLSKTLDSNPGPWFQLEDPHLQCAQNKEVVVDFLGHLVHVAADEAHVALPQVGARPRDVVLVLKEKTTQVRFFK